jgi:hypothetical protein
MPAPSDATSGPPDAVAKQNVRMAVSAMENHYADAGSYTSDAAQLTAAGFPSAVRVERFAADGYTLSSTTADGFTYAIDRSASLTVRRCSPIKPPFCRDGTW